MWTYILITSFPIVFSILIRSVYPPKTLDQHPPAPGPSSPLSLSLSFPSPFLWRYRNHLMTSPPLRLSFLPVSCKRRSDRSLSANLLPLNSSKTEFLITDLKTKLSVLDNSSLNITHSAHILGFYARQHNTIASNSDRNVSVRPSVTRRYCVKTISSPSGSPMILVF